MLSRRAPTNLHLVALLQLQILLIVCLDHEVPLLGTAVIVIVFVLDLLGRVPRMVDAIGGGRGGEGGRHNPLHWVHG